MCRFIPEKIPLRLEANCKKPVILKHIKRKHTRALAMVPRQLWEDQILSISKTSVFYCTLTDKWLVLLVRDWCLLWWCDGSTLGSSWLLLGHLCTLSCWFFKICFPIS